MAQKRQRRFMMRSVILSVLAIAIIYVVYANFTKDERGKLKVGDQAPNFVLTDVEGNKHRLSDYRGKGVFLNFWGTWCKPCEKEMPYMNNQYKVFRDQGVEILAVNVGESDFAVNKFINKHHLVFPVLIDKKKDVLQTYGIVPLPTTVMIDPNGKVTHISKGELTEKNIEALMKSVMP